MTQQSSQISVTSRPRSEPPVNHRRLGLVTEIFSDVLDDGEHARSAERQPAKEAFDAKLCPECSCVQPPRSRECPQCGHIFYAITLVREREGELVELGARATGSKRLRTEAKSISQDGLPQTVQESRM
jgi:hypothetical protein